MHSNHSVDPSVYRYRPSYTALLALDARDTGMEFLTLYRQLLTDIEHWCHPIGAPITQVIRRQALRDYLDVYCQTYPRQPSCPFPPRFGRYAAYLDGFDDIVTAIDAWCGWLSHQFLPGVMPIDLLRSAIDESDAARRTTELPNAHSIHSDVVLLEAMVDAPIEQ